MTTKNRYGLSRRVPADVKRVIRQRCGFGCVICGFGFYEYEHFDPDFADATEHNPTGMTLLCSQCNQKRARGRLSAESVALANINPKCLEQGFANELFDFHSEPLEIIFGGMEFYNCKHLIVVNERPILTVQPSPMPNSPMLLSGVFCDELGRDMLKIEENEWSVKSDNWDVDIEGPRIIIRSAPRQISLVLKMNPPKGIIVERLDMTFEGVRFKGDEQTLKFTMDGNYWHKWSGCSVRNGYVGIAIETRPRAANDPVYIF